MSEFHVEVVRIGAVSKHENADALEITQVHGGYPCIIKSGSFREGDLAVYVPVDALVQTSRSEFAFLGSRPLERIRAKKLRGVFSMGLLVPAPPGAAEGDDVREALGVEKWEPAIDLGTSALAEPPPEGPPIPIYDLEGLRKLRGLLVEGEEVVITEKIHGCNARFFHDGTRLWAGSRNNWKREDEDKLWWPVARSLEERLKCLPSGYVIYGEVFGQVQDLKYGQAAAAFRAFDILDRRTGHFLDADTFREICAIVRIDAVPELYRGPWSESLMSLAEGESTLAAHVREGFVVRPVVERVHPRHGRVVLKMVGEGYLTRKGG